MNTAHAFRPIKPGSNRCQMCGGWSDNSTHSLAFWNDADHEREAARQAQEAAEMTAKMRRPLRDVSKAAGVMERLSPLFYGTGNNPTLFG